MGNASHSTSRRTGTSFAEQMDVSPDIEGCRFGRGEGAVVIVLKPLDDALRDHDHIYATVRTRVTIACAYLTCSGRSLELVSTRPGLWYPRTRLRLRHNETPCYVRSVWQDVHLKMSTSLSFTPQVCFRRLWSDPVIYLPPYVHCSAGTAQGDPTEANWAGAEFQRDDDDVLLGSVKGNVGYVTSPLTSFTHIFSHSSFSKTPRDYRILCISLQSLRCA